jgi:hypothetical protein
LSLSTREEDTGGVSLIAPGVRLHDRYAVAERIGAGGMSEVWRATDELLGRQVAVKVLATADPAGVTWREARAAARLTHPNVTQVHDYGEAELPDGRVLPYLVMELVDGQPLASRLPLPWPEAVRVAEQVAAALAAAHRIGVVHRDVKPANVMLTETGVKVLDFGIAAVAGADTDPGRMAGTPTYTAPERLDPGRPAQPLSDVYSLGVLLYEALAGRPPVQLATWPAAAAAHREGLVVPPLAVPGLPEPVAELCRACLAPDPAARPSAWQVAAALADAERPEAGAVFDQAPTTPMPRRYASGSARPVAAVSQTRVDQPPGPWSRRWLGIAAAVVAGALGLVLLVSALGSDPPADPSDQAGGPEQTVTTTPSGAPAPATTAGPATTAPAEARPPADGPPTENVVVEFDQAIDDGVAAGRVSEDAEEKLEEKLGDLREAFAETENPNKPFERAEQLQEEIDRLVEDRELHPATANELTRILDPLL